jgi:predicted GNAT family N-acyltransferase
MLIKRFTTADPDWAHARNIRITVFVHEQQVPEEEELDEFEESARHFIAYVEGEPAGTCRWRYTEKGVKMERFAVSKAFRGKGVGIALLRAALQDVAEQPQSAGKLRYLHSQVTAMFLYEKAGFKAVGEPFDECGIMHYKMELQ